MDEEFEEASAELYYDQNPGLDDLAADMQAAFSGDDVIGVGVSMDPGVEVQVNFSDGSFVEIDVNLECFVY